MVAFMSEITVSIQLNHRQAEAYLKFLVSQYQQAMAACWYSDKYRYTPDGLRGRKIFEDHPHIAGLGRSTRELRKQLSQLGEQS